MRKFFSAQSTLEFIMLLILVLAGIFVMGPYVIRSVNAYMRSWEIAASDAQHKLVSASQFSVCGNGVCEPGENNFNCPADCYCGNGTCDPGESYPSCADCPPPPSFCQTHACADCPVWNSQGYANNICMIKTAYNWNYSTETYQVTQTCEDYDPSNCEAYQAAACCTDSTGFALCFTEPFWYCY